jgi:hypothetical protein
VPGAVGDNYRALAATSWQAHVYGVAGTELAAWCQQRGLPLHVFPWHPNYRKAGFAQDALYLLRPDAYIALADEAASSEALQQYLADRGLQLYDPSSAPPGLR